MRTLLLTLALIGSSAPSAAQPKPNMSGFWRVREAYEFYFIDHHEPNITIRSVIHDSIGFRVLTVKGPIDGKEHHQTIENGSPGVFTASWDGDRLIWETKRTNPNGLGLLHYRRTMQLSSDGMTLTADYSRLAPSPPDVGYQSWQRLGESSTIVSDPHDIQQLTRRDVIDRSVSGYSAAAYQVSLLSGQFLDIAIDRHGVSTRSVVFGPDGEAVAIRDSSGRHGTDHAYLIASRTGLHRLEVYTFGTEGERGSYAISIANQRDATEQDRLRNNAELLLAHAKRSSMTSDSLKPLDSLRAMFRTLGDSSREAEVIAIKAQTHATWLHDWAAAEPLYLEALKINRADSDRDAEAENLRALGNSDAARVQNASQGIARLLSALEIYRSLGDQGKLVSINADLGRAYTVLGEHQLALDAQLRRLSVARSIRDSTLGTVMITVGLAYLSLGDKDNALTSFMEAVHLHRSEHHDFLEAITLRLIGELFAKRGENEKALDFYQDGLIAAQRARSRSAEINILSGMGTALLNLQKYESALVRLNQALTLAKTSDLNDVLGQARALNEIGVVYYRLKQPANAIPYATEALRLRAALNNPGNEMAALRHLLISYAALEDTQTAVAFFAKEASMARASNNSLREQTVSSVLLRLGSELSSQGQVDGAIAFFRQALTGDVEWPQQLRRSLFEGLRCVFTYILYDQSKALEVFDQELAEAHALGDKEWEAATLLGRAISYRYPLTDKDLWFRNCMRAIDIYRSIGNQEEEARVLAMVAAESIRGGGHREQAIAYLQRAHSLAANLKKPQINLFLDVAAGLLWAQRQPEGIECIEAAARLAEATPSAVSPEIYARLVSLYRWLAPEKRLERLRLAEQRYPLAGLEISVVKADRLEKAGALLEARNELETGIRKLELGAVPSYHSVDDVIVPYDYGLYSRLREVLMRLNGQHPSEALSELAFEAHEKSRTRAFVSRLLQSRVTFKRGVDLLMFEREHALEQMLTNRTDERLRALGAHASAEELERIDVDIGNTLSNYQNIRRLNSSNRSGYSRMTLPEPLTVRQVQQELLDDETVLLEYSLNDDHSYLWAVTRQRMQSFELPSKTKIEANVRLLTALLADRASRHVGESEGQYRYRLARVDSNYSDVAAQLSQMVLNPVASLIKGKRLLVVGDGALQSISFAALPDPTTSMDASRPLIVGHEIVNLPSASALFAIRKETAARPIAPKAVAVFADPVFSLQDARFIRLNGSVSESTSIPSLRTGGFDEAGLLQRATTEASLTEGKNAVLPRIPFTRREADAIQAYVKSEQQGVFATGFRANFSAATAETLGEYRIIHFATHGLLNDRHPELSGLILSLYNERGEPQNGFLKLQQVYNLNVPAELVVLSACQTALGRETPGEGLIGLTRGFMYAGAKRVIASLWRVDDMATAELMGKLYRGMLLEHLSPAAALRAAQVSMWKRKSTQSPYYWAAFTLQGEWK